MPSDAGGPEGRLRSWAVTLFMFTVALDVGSRLIAAVAPVLCAVAVVAVAVYVIWLTLQRRRW